MLRKMIATVLSLAVGVSVFASYGTVAYAKKAEEIIIPDPVAVYDFSYNFEELKEQDPGFSVVENEAAPELVQDEKMGQVLKLNKSIVENREFVMIFDSDSGTTNSSGYIASEDAQYSQIDITNPYKGVNHLKEYEIWEDVNTKLYRNCKQPYWQEGITISYWIKTPAGEDGYGINSNIVGFTSNRFQMQADDLARYLSTVAYGRDYNEFTEEEKKILGITAPGVDSASSYYFELAEAESYNGAPLYTENLGENYYMNPNYEEGYILCSDGTIVESKAEAAADPSYQYLPHLGDTEEDHDPGNSMIRYAWTYSEMWLDASSSFYFENDTANVNKQLNSNHGTSYGVLAGMQNNDCFNINSWKSYNTYAEAADNGMAGDSPVTLPDEWHYVTCVIQNDWVMYYLDGEEIDIEEYYSSFGGNGLATTVGTGYKPWKRFNKGTGSRYGYGHNKTEIYDCSFGNYVCTTMMEWLIKDCVNAKIGGGNVAGDGYMMYAETDEVQIKNVVFYDKMLDEDQIELLAEDPFYYDKNKVEETKGLLGDANLDTIIDAADALAVLKHAATLQILESEAAVNADVNTDGIIDASDALEILKYAAGIINEFTPAQ